MEGCGERRANGRTFDLVGVGEQWMPRPFDSARGRLFAFFAKGGSWECWRKFVDHAAVYHKSSSTGSIASHPYKECKDGAPTLLVMAGRSKSLGQPSQPTYLGYPHLETETDQVRSNNEKHQVVVADYHAEVFTESADHGSD